MPRSKDGCGVLPFVAGIGVLLCTTIPTSADVIGFEGYAPPASLTIINKSFTYSEDHFGLVVGRGSEIIFDANFTDAKLAGDSTSFLGFASGAFIVMQRESDLDPFTLNSFLVGSTTFSGNLRPQNPAVDVTVVGIPVEGGPESATFTGLSAATLETLNWTNLLVVTFTTSTLLETPNFVALDDITVDEPISVTSVSEPMTLSLFGAGLAGAAAMRRRRRKTIKPSLSSALDLAQDLRCTAPGTL